MPPETRTEHLGTLQAALLALAVAACRFLAVRACPTYDDAFITYRYAEHLAAGHGLVFNVGAPWEPVLGTTTVLYSLVMALFAGLNLEIVRASLVFNVACDVVTALLLLGLLRSRPVAATVALLGLAALPQLVRISVGGMESPLFLLCALAACVALQRGRPVAAGLLAAATCLVRPEGVLLAGILFAVLARRPRELVRYVVPVLAVGLIAAAVLTAVYGTPIPQSVLAKSAMQGKDPAAEKVQRFWTALQQSFLPTVYYLPALPLVAWGALRALREGGAVRLVSCFALAISASYLLARPHTWGWYYYVPLAAWVLWLGLGAEHVFTWLRARVPAGTAGAALRFGPQALAVLLTAAVGVAAARAPSPIPDKVYAPLWAWAERASPDGGSRILASDIGAIGHRWKGTVLDSEGLTWPAALGYRYPLAIIEATWPEYLMVVAERPRLRHLAERPDIMAHYEPIARFNATGQTRLDLRPEDVPMDWSQDYLIYGRKGPAPLTR
jgi:hypothetical protein